VIVLIIVTTLVALGGALLLYLGLERSGPAGVPLALIRALAWAGVVALLLDPGCRGKPPAPTVLLDASLSMGDASSDARWRAAVDTALRLAAGGPVVLFGVTPASWREGARPAAPSSRLLPALREALSRGGPIVVVTDGEVDDVAALPADAMRAARVMVLPRPAAADAGIAGMDLPGILVAGDTAVAQVAVASAGGTSADSATVELREEGRTAGRTRVPLGGGATRASVRFVPAPASADRSIRRFEARLTGWRRDADPRNDTFRTAAAVTREAAVVLLSESPDYDFRVLAHTLGSAHATPVRSFVRVTDGPWRDAATLAPVGDAAVRGAAGQATLLVVHGPEAAVARLAGLGRRSVWRWVTGPGGGAQSGDWYVAAEQTASPVSGPLAGVPAESLPPLAAMRAAPGDSAAWTAVLARLGRRGPARPLLVGDARDGRRSVSVLGSGLWRWTSKGGVAEEGYRALVLGIADWLLERRAEDDAGVQVLRDSLSRGVREYLPRRPTLSAQAGGGERGAAERTPLQQRPWVFGAILAALCVEWVVRRRRGMR
jgi:hypothetical protein